MPSWPPKKNAAFTITLPILDADGDPVAGAVGLSSVVAGADGVALLPAFAAGPVPVDETEGFYSIELTAAQMNFDRVAGVLKTTTGGAKNTPFTLHTVTRQIDDLAFPTVSGRGLLVNAVNRAEADVQTWLTVAVNALVTGRVDASVGAMAAAVLTAAAIAADAIDNTKIAAGAITASEAPNLDAAVSTRAAPGAAMDLVAAAINSIYDELTAEARVAGSYGQLLKDNLNAAISSRAVPGDAMDLVVNAVDALALAADAVDEVWDELLPELAQAVPPAVPSGRQAVMLQYMALRNLLQVTAAEKRVTNDLGTVITKKALSDDGTTYAEAEMVAGP